MNQRAAKTFINHIMIALRRYIEDISSQYDGSGRLPTTAEPIM